jgi:hypothetical protein
VTAEPIQPEVTIIGAGMAGLTAALYLAERGYKVTIYEKEPSPGGNLGATRYQGADFEVFPHMYGEWYVNFFRLAARLGFVRDDGENNGAFRSCTKSGYLRPSNNKNVKSDPVSRSQWPEAGEGDGLRYLVNMGDPATFLRNMASDVVASRDIFLATYAAIDIITQDFSQLGLPAEQTLNGFLASRPYATQGMLQVFEDEMLCIWGIDSYITSAHAYQNFAKYAGASPAPFCWTLPNISDSDIVKRLRDFLVEKYSVGVIENTEVLGITAEEIEAKCAKVTKIAVSNRTAQRHRGHVSELRVENLILAVAPSALGLLLTISADDALTVANDPTASGLRVSLNNTVANYVPSLTQTRLLDSGPVAVLYVPLKRTFDFIPTYYVSLVNSPAALTFVERPYLREKLGAEMVLAIGISAVTALPSWRGRGPVDGPVDHKTDESSDKALNEWLDSLAESGGDLWNAEDLTNVKIKIKEMANEISEESKKLERAKTNRHIANDVLQEFIQYVPSDQRADFRESVIQGSIYLKANNTEHLFLNSVGSRENSPPTRCPKLSNLFFATGTIDNPIEIATVECAVVGGLLAAGAFRHDNPVSGGIAEAERILPDAPLLPPQDDLSTLLALRIILVPWAMAAKFWDNAEELCRANRFHPIGPTAGVLDALWIASLAPGTFAVILWDKLFPPRSRPIEAPDGRASQITSDALEVMDTALQMATDPTWFMIQAVRLVADTLWWPRRSP